MFYIHFYWPKVILSNKWRFLFVIFTGVTIVYILDCQVNIGVAQQLCKYWRPPYVRLYNVGIVGWLFFWGGWPLSGGLLKLLILVSCVALFTLFNFFWCSFQGHVTSRGSTFCKKIKTKYWWVTCLAINTVHYEWLLILPN